ncbi:MAG: DNA methyltransferase [Nitrospirota bacterium]
MKKNYAYVAEDDDMMIAEPSAPFSVKRPLSSIISAFIPTLFNLDELPPKISKTKNGFAEEITKIDGEIPVDLEVKNGDRFLFISYDQSVLTHGLHKYPAKFFPELPRWLIYKYSKEGDWVIDPFTGSGTVNLECLLARRHSVGVDVDPFSKFLARVKLTPLKVEHLQKAHTWLKKKISEYKSNIPLEKDFPQFPYRDNWFNRYIIEELTFLKRIIYELEKEIASRLDKNDAKKIRNFFLICFSSIIRGVSNADDNCTRTVIRKKLNKQVKKGDALSKFIRVIDINVPKMTMFSEICPTNIKVDIPDGSDARDIKYPDNYFHLAITSPPYVNAVDYPRTHQLEMYWLGIENGSLASLKKKHVGTETVSSSEYQHLHKIGIKDADKLLAKIYEKDPRRSFILYKFLIDMQENLIEVRRVLKPGGKYVIVIGNNKMRSYLVESWKYLMEIAEQVGFKIHCYFASEIIKHFIKVPREERINTDWVIVLEK